MNAAARALTQGNFFQGEYSHIPLTRDFWVISLLLVAVLLSALAVVYGKNYERQLYSDMQMANHRASELHIEKGQLLLEKSTLSNPARVQKLAIERLNMVMPEPEDILVIKG